MITPKLMGRSSGVRGALERFAKSIATAIDETARTTMFVIKKKSAAKSNAEWAAVKSTFMQLGIYFIAVRVMYVAGSRLRA
ncbi:hypothetical protein SO694_00017124 [Aureococcus anophagefferens]|uniref:ABC transmembrane type-1 domain-containing protein n=1 Tax=Aureococcus anophagefferens TaxID=44056 RepID=A0ABR1G1Y6_AURAN